MKHQDYSRWSPVIIQICKHFFTILSLDFVITACLTSRCFLPLLPLFLPRCFYRRKLPRSLQTGINRVRRCGQRGTSWPHCWLSLPQCPGHGRRWSMTSWAASPGEHPSWSGNMSTSTWTGWSGSSCCRVRKQICRKQLQNICSVSACLSWRGSVKVGHLREIHESIQMNSYHKWIITLTSVWSLFKS